MPTIKHAHLRRLRSSGLSEAAIAARFRVPAYHVTAALAFRESIESDWPPQSAERLLHELRHADRRRQVLLLMGGCCVACGYRTYLGSLRVHAVEAGDRGPNSNGIRDWKWERLVEAIRRSVLLCANCLGAVESRELRIEEYVQPALAATRRRLDLVMDLNGRAARSGIEFDESAKGRAAGRYAGTHGNRSRSRRRRAA